MESSLWRKTPCEDSRDPEQEYASGDDRAERVKGERQLPLAVSQSIQSARHPTSRTRKSRELPKWAEHNGRKRGGGQTDEEYDEHNQKDSHERPLAFFEEAPISESLGMGSPHASSSSLHVSPLASRQRRFSSLCMSTKLITPRLKIPRMREITGRLFSERPARRFRSAMSEGYL